MRNIHHVAAQKNLVHTSENLFPTIKQPPNTNSLLPPTDSTYIGNQKLRNFSKPLSTILDI